VRHSIKLDQFDNLVLTLALEPPATNVPGLDSCPSADVRPNQKTAVEYRAKDEIGGVGLVPSSPTSFSESEAPLCRLCGKNAASLETVTLRDLERWHIARVIETCGSLATAAEALGINYSTLWRKRKRYKML
jgi:DNA-binding NtrC family response regulator